MKDTLLQRSFIHQVAASVPYRILWRLMAPYSEIRNHNRLELSCKYQRASTSLHVCTRLWISIELSVWYKSGQNVPSIELYFTNAFYNQLSALYSNCVHARLNTNYRHCDGLLAGPLRVWLDNLCHSDWSLLLGPILTAPGRSTFVDTEEKSGWPRASWFISAVQSTKLRSQCGRSNSHWRIGWYGAQRGVASSMDMSVCLSLYSALFDCSFRPWRCICRSRQIPHDCCSGFRAVYDFNKNQSFLQTRRQHSRQAFSIARSFFWLVKHRLCSCTSDSESV